MRLSIINKKHTNKKIERVHRIEECDTVLTKVRNADRNNTAVMRNGEVGNRAGESPSVSHTGHCLTQ